MAVYTFSYPFPVVDEATGAPQPNRVDGVLYDTAGVAHTVTSIMGQAATVTTTNLARIVPFQSDINRGIIRFGNPPSLNDPGTTVLSDELLNSLDVAEDARDLAANAQTLAEAAEAAAGLAAAAAQAAQTAAEAAAAGGGGGGSGSVVITSEDSDGYVDVSGAGVVMTAEDSDGYVTLTIA